MAIAGRAEPPRTPSADEVARILPEGVGRPGTEQRILAMSARLLAERGTYGASIRDIAAAVGIRSSGLYEYFPSKDHIIATLVEVGHRSQLDVITDAQAAHPDDPAGQVRHIVRTLVALSCRYPEVSIVAVDELARLPEELAAPSHALRDQAQLHLLAIALQGQELGRFSAADLGVATAAIGSLIVRVPRWFVPRADLSVDKLGDLYAEFALRILGAAHPGA